MCDDPYLCRLNLEAMRSPDCRCGLGCSSDNRPGTHCLRYGGRSFPGCVQDTGGVDEGVGASVVGK